MADDTFLALLTGSAEVLRPEVALSSDGAPMTPTYERAMTGLRVRMAPAGTLSDDGLLGRRESVTHVVYAEPADVRASDRLVLRPETWTLAADAPAGSDLLSFGALEAPVEGQCLEVGSGDTMETVTVREVEDGTVYVTPALTCDHLEGDPVVAVDRYEVIEVEDVAGAGHHLRLLAREL